MAIPRRMPLQGTRLFSDDRRFASALVITICLLGCFLRAYPYGINRSLWFDEAMLGLNIVDRSFPDLLRPLDYNQGAPLGFLILQKAIANSLSGRDYMLRLFPFLAGVTSVPLMYIVAKQYGKGVAPVVALGLFAISTQLIYYSSELKQYSSDVLITLLLLLAAPRCLKSAAKWRSFAVLGMVGVLAIWMSHPSVFTASGIVLAMSATLILRRDSRRLFWLLGVGLLWTVNLALLYCVSLRYVASNSALLDYWKGSFAPLPPWGNFGWYYGALSGILNNPTGFPVTPITAGLLTLGICSLAFRRWQFAVILIAPVMLTLIASALRKYPFGGRLSLFMVPVLFLVIAEGVERGRMLLLKVSRPGAALAASGLCIYLMHSPGLAAYHNLRSPFRGEDIKPVMSYLRQNRLNGDLIYVYYGAQPAFEFYAPLYGLTRADYRVGVSARTDPEQYRRDIDGLKGHERVWFVVSHNCSWCAVNEESYCVQQFEERGTLRDGVRSAGASIYLYDLVQSPGAG